MKIYIIKYLRSTHI